MSKINDLQYFAGRAETERLAAAKATDPTVAAVHRQMVIEYEAVLNERGHHTSDE